MFKKLSTIFIFILLIGISQTHSANQATLRFGILSDALPVGSEFSLKIIVDSEIPLNAYKLDFAYDPSGLKLLGFDNSRSIVAIWQSEPRETERGRINLSGGSIKPFQGNGGEILSVRFKTLQAGKTAFTFLNVSVYLADGKGTGIIPARENLSLNVLPQQSNQPLSEETPKNADGLPKDTTQPQIEFLSFVADPFNPDQKILSFSVKDTGSGVKESLARSRKLFFWGDWQLVVNPVAVSNDVWAVDFLARDNSGNVTVATIYDWPAFARKSLIFLIFLAAGVFLVINRALKYRRVYNKS